MGGLITTNGSVTLSDGARIAGRPGRGGAVAAAPGRRPLRLDRSARHWLAIVGVVFAAYLSIATDFSSIVQASSYAGTIPNDVPLVNVVQFLTILAVYLASFALIATTPMRRAVALTVVPLALFGWAFLSVERATGVLPLGDSQVWTVLLDQGFVTVAVALSGWLIARGLRPLSWLVLLLALLPPILGFPLTAANADSTVYSLTIQGAVVVAGGLGAWLALVIDRAGRREGTGSRVSDVALSRSARYGLGLGSVVVATYLNIATDFTGYLNATSVGGGSSVSSLDVVQFVLILVIYGFAFGVMPVSPDRRVAAITLASVVLLLWATFGIERSVGNLTEPSALWFFVLNQGFITLLVSLGGWLIVRGRHPLAFVVLAVAIVPPLFARSLDDAGVTSGFYTLAMEGAIVACGAVGGTVAWLIDAVMRRLRGERITEIEDDPEIGPAETVPGVDGETAGRDRPSRPRPVTAIAIIVWVLGAVEMLTGIFALAGQSVSGEDQRAGALAVALVTVAIGLATVFAGVGLLRGNRAARVLVTVFIGLSVVGDASDLVTAIRAGSVAGAVVEGVIIALELLAVVALWFGRARVFFRKARDTPIEAKAAAE